MSEILSKNQVIFPDLKRIRGIITQMMHLEERGQRKGSQHDNLPANIYTQ